MNRRKCLLTLLGMGILSNRRLWAAGNAIQLHLDLEVDPSREKEMVENYHKIFRPAISKQPGFGGVKLLKLRETLAGPGPANRKYRLLISFATEDQRKQWVATDEHQRVWPTIRNTLTGGKYTAILYEVV
ncbi:hypothetical protein MYX78_00460 [Acidobacteria bacterium AH-259-G07]|nr:hypothetical protein [Acidobacteria bacterium AH-259-G07]